MYDVWIQRWVVQRELITRNVGPGWIQHCNERSKAVLGIKKKNLKFRFVKTSLIGIGVAHAQIRFWCWFTIKKQMVLKSFLGCLSCITRCWWWQLNQKCTKRPLVFFQLVLFKARNVLYANFQWKWSLGKSNMFQGYLYWSKLKKKINRISNKV